MELKPESNTRDDTPFPWFVMSGAEELEAGVRLAEALAAATDAAMTGETFKASQRLRRGLHAVTASDPAVDAVSARMTAGLVATLRRGIDELSRIDCAGRPDRAAKVNDEIAWLAAGPWGGGLSPREECDGADQAAGGA